jgi:hypothetical protein
VLGFGFVVCFEGTVFFSCDDRFALSAEYPRCKRNLHSRVFCSAFVWSERAKEKEDSDGVSIASAF